MDGLARIRITARTPRWKVRVRSMAFSARKKSHQKIYIFWTSSLTAQSPTVRHVSSSEKPWWYRRWLHFFKLMCNSPKKLNRNWLMTEDNQQIKASPMKRCADRHRCARISNVLDSGFSGWDIWSVAGSKPVGAFQEFEVFLAHTKNRPISIWGVSVFCGTWGLREEIETHYRRLRTVGGMGFRA